MPKLIENLRENILARAKKELLKNGYGALTIRGIARECGIAAGTVYNYFESKEMLVASVMMEDWVTALREMKSACSEAGGIEDALTALYDGVARFYDTYRSVWAGYTFSGSGKSEYGKRRYMLVRQIADCARAALERFSPDAPDDTDIFIAENILSCAGSSLLTFDSFLVIAKRII